MQNDSEDFVFRLKLSQYVVQRLGMLEWTCGDSETKTLQKQSGLLWDGWELYICRRVPSNFSEERRTSKRGWTLLAPGKYRSRSLSEKQLLKIALHWLSSGQFHWVTRMVCLNSSARVSLVISDRRWPAIQKQVTVPVADLQLSHQPIINRHRPNRLQKHCPFQRCLGWGSLFRCTSPPYIHVFLSFLHCLFLSEIQ